MGIAASDIVYLLTGATTDGGAQTNPNASLGKFRGSGTITSGGLNNLYDDITGAEGSAGNTDYRCYCIKNNGTVAFNSPKVYISTAINDSAGTISFAVETPGTANLTNGSAQTITAEGTSPLVGTTGHIGAGSGISSWATGTTYASGVGVNQGAHGTNMAAGDIIFVWVKRQYGSGANAYSNASVSLGIEGK